MERASGCLVLSVTEPDLMTKGWFILARPSQRQTGSSFLLITRKCPTPTPSTKPEGNMLQFALVPQPSLDFDTRNPLGQKGVVGA